MPREHPPLPTPAHDTPPEGVGEDVWIDVIRKMDEVYSDLLQYEVALEEKNAALEETQKFLFSVLTSMSDILVVCDRHGAIQEVNQALAELSGRGEGELRGAPLASLFADEASRGFMARLLAASWRRRAPARPRAVAGHPWRRQHAGGHELHAAPEPGGQARRAGAHRPTGGRAAPRLRRLRQAHEDLKQAQHQLVHSEKMASLGRLVAGVAHELNNPISFVLGNVYALQRYGARLREYLDALHGGASPEALAGLRRALRIDRLLDDLQPLLEGTREGAERTRDIVAGLRRFSAADRDENTDFDLAEIIERSVHWVVKATGSRIAVRFEPTTALPVCGSPGQMQQVMVNLVQNAIDSTDARGAQARLDIDATCRGQTLRVVFRDNGPGFAPEALSRVFDPFYTTKPVGKGTGLGLSISYGIVERHGGHLEAANAEGGGAMLTLTLPLAAGSGSTSPRP
jgi:two-component system sensor histidine kinase HupT/HoxJ